MSHDEKKFYSTSFSLFTGGKLREFSNPSSDLRLMINDVTNELLALFPDVKGTPRDLQSQRDIDAHLKYDFCLSFDGKNALLSAIVSRCSIALVLFYPKLISLVPSIIKIYFAPVFDDFGNEIKGKKNKLKAGYRLSAPFLHLLFRPWLYFFNRYLGFAQIYMDDCILYSNYPFLTKLFFHFLRFYFFILGFRFHKILKIQLNKRPHKAASRLGLHFGFDGRGNLKTKVRAQTLRRYYKRLEKSLYCPSSIAFIRVRSILFEGEFYPLHVAFPKEIWTDDIQRRQFTSRWIGLLRRRYPSLRKMSKEQIILTIWGHSIAKLPVHG